MELSLKIELPIEEIQARDLGESSALFNYF